MTIIYTETHLTSDPEEFVDSIVFQIALSTITFYCQTHREESINYIKAHKIRTGDIVQIYGVLITEPKQYIKVSSIKLITFPGIGTKKRRIDEVSSGAHLHYHQKRHRTIASTISQEESIPMANAHESTGNITSPRENQTQYVNFGNHLGHYFYYLYGKAQFACSHVSQNTARESQKKADRLASEIERCQQETGNELNKLITEIYHLAIETTKRELSKLSVLLFISKVTEFTEKVKDLLNTCPAPVPFGLEMEERIPLPSCIFEYYNAYCTH